MQYIIGTLTAEFSLHLVFEQYPLLRIQQLDSKAEKMTKTWISLKLTRLEKATRSKVSGGVAFSGLWSTESGPSMLVDDNAVFD